MRRGPADGRLGWEVVEDDRQQLVKEGQDPRERAIARLKQSATSAHLFVYLVVNGFLIGIWAFGEGSSAGVRLGHRVGVERLGRVLAQARVGIPSPP